VAEELLSRSKQALATLNEEIGPPIEIRARPGLHQEQFELSVLEPGSPVELDLPWLRDTHPDAESEARSGGTGPDGRSDEGEAKRNGRRRRRGGRGRSSETLIAEGELPPEGGGDGAGDDASDEPLAGPVGPPAGEQVAESVEGVAPEQSPPAVEPEGGSGDSPQTVDSEVESRIIPRSE
jgi:hypothetical protein